MSKRKAKLKKSINKRRKNGYHAWFLLSAIGSHVVGLHLLDILAKR